ncbi:hypothetical protein LEMLEM_LOCUS13290 [Lemmus lemmus]
MLRSLIHLDLSFVHGDRWEMVRRLWMVGEAQVPKAKWRACHKPSGAANMERDVRTNRHWI